MDTFYGTRSAVQSHKIKTKQGFLKGGKFFVYKYLKKSSMRVTLCENCMLISAIVFEQSLPLKSRFKEKKKKIRDIIQQAYDIFRTNFSLKTSSLLEVMYNYVQINSKVHEKSH